MPAVQVLGIPSNLPPQFRKNLEAGLKNAIFGVQNFGVKRPESVKVFASPWLSEETPHEVIDVIFTSGLFREYRGNIVDLKQRLGAAIAGPIQELFPLVKVELYCNSLDKTLGDVVIIPPSDAKT